MEYNWTGSWFASVVDFLPFPLGSPPVSYRLCLFEMVIDFTIQSFKLCTNKKIKLHWHKFFFYVIGLSERWLFLLNYLLITVPLRPSFTWMIRFHWGIVLSVVIQGRQSESKRLKENRDVLHTKDQNVEEIENKWRKNLEDQDAKSKMKEAKLLEEINSLKEEVSKTESGRLIL